LKKLEIPLLSSVFDEVANNHRHQREKDFE